MHPEIQAVTFADIQAAQARLAGVAIRTPLIRCPAMADGGELYLKLENLQEIGSFKVRPISSAVLSRPVTVLGDGIYTSSTGNSAAGVAWIARRLGIPATAVVPETVPAVKLRQLQQLGATILKIPHDDWWRSIEDARYPAAAGLYVDAVRDPAALAGDGTVGLEILEDMPDVDAIFVPFGGGGLACGIACAVRGLRPSIKVIACELASASPLTNSRQADSVVSRVSHAGFVTGVGYDSILPEMWPLARRMIDDTITVTLEETARAIRILGEGNHVIVEGAGAIPVAAALSGRHGYRRICAVVSGGNIDHGLFARFMAGDFSAAT